MNTNFVSLHTHSTYSYGDGYGQPIDFVEQAALLGHPALALTEHGNVSSHVKLERAAKARSIKPIFGCELYARDKPNQFKFHMGVLAMNQQGYKDLLSLVSASWNNFYYFPTTTSGMLRTYGDNLIILSGCLGSSMACNAMGGKGIEQGRGLGAALRIASVMREAYGDRYYLELQAFPELERAQMFNRMLIEVHKRLGIPIVATLDAHYPRAENGNMHSMIHAIARGGAAGKKTVDQMEESWDYNVPMTLFGRQEVGQRLRAAGVDNRLLVSQALDTTVEIADRCNVALTKMPRVIFPLPKGVGSAEDLLWQELRNGWRYRDMDHHLARDMTREDYASRLKMEMGLIVDKGFVDYFLVLGDIIRWAKGRGIVVGPARGSAGASLVSYMLRITEIDPLEYAQMYFERFIDPNRTDLPDIDLDFDDERRDEIRKYAIDKYGMDHVGNIGTFTKYKGKNALDDVARVTRVPLPEVTRLKEFVIERSSGDSRYSKTLEDTMDQFPLARAVMERNPSLSKAFELEGMLKSMGIHAAGLVISDKPLTDVCAIYTREVNNAFRGKRKVSVLSVDKYDGEYLGMMKIDTLGLTTLGMIRICLEMTGMTLEQLYALPFNDERVIDAFRRCDVKGIFQYEGRTTKSIVAQLKPDNFQELIDINALSRPGPYHSGTTLNYINEKWGHWDKNAEVNKWTQNEVVKSICGYTKDQMIYQEQMLAICREMGNLPWVKLGEIRKIISLKYGEAAFLSHMKAFLEGAVANGHDPAEAENIFRHMITAGQYAFNLAHSVAYSMLGYWSMYFKVYHPEAFYAASLRKADKAKWAFLMRDMIDEHFAGLRGDGRDITVGPLDINKSDITWTTGHGVITPGFAQVPGIGYKLAAGIVWERNTAEKLGQGWDWPDIRLVSGIGPAKFEAIQGWAKATDPFGVSTLRLKLNEVRVMLRAGYLVDNGGRMLPAPSHKSEDLPYDMGVSFTDAKGNPTWGREGALPVTWIGRVRGRNLRDLFEEHRSREGSDLDPTTIKEPNKKLSMVLYAYDDTDEINVRVSRWKYEGMKDLLMQMKLDHDIIVVDGYKTKSFGRKIEADRMWLIDPD